MANPREITQPNYHRLGKNLGVAAIPRGRFIKPGAAQDEVVLAAAATDQCEGVTSEEIPVGGHRSYQVDGKALVEAGGAIALHSLIAPTAVGKAAVAATGNLIRGRAMSVAAADGDLIEVELWKGRHVAP